MPWWVMRYTDTGRAFMIDNCFPSENRADRHLETSYGGNGKVYETESADRKKAAQEIRAQLAQENNNAWGRNFKHGKA